jgi:hypothetical protein
MKKYVFITIAILLLIIIFFFYYVSRTPDMAQFEHLKVPAISNKANEKVMFVKTVGAPEKSAQNAFKLLFQTYYKTKNVEKSHMVAPRSRWFVEQGTPVEKWEGHFAIPVPDKVTEVPVLKDDSGLKVELATWEYGDVAEILHIGPYDKEMPAVDKLMKFIADNGYEIAGPHEEEYVIGPSPFFPRNPNKFVTIIRFQVKKKQN